MSLHLHPFPAVPAETARVARAVFPTGHLSLRLRDELGAISEDQAFVEFFAAGRAVAAGQHERELDTSH